jgi:hypothetical protein
MQSDPPPWPPLPPPSITPPFSIPKCSRRNEVEFQAAAAECLWWNDAVSRVGYGVSEWINKIQPGNPKKK